MASSLTNPPFAATISTATAPPIFNSSASEMPEAPFAISITPFREEEFNDEVVGVVGVDGVLG